MYDADYEQYKRELLEEAEAAWPDDGLNWLEPGQKDLRGKYDAGLEELENKSYSNSPDYVTKDSGKKAVHADGVQRDTEAGKPRFDLFLPEGVPFDEQLLTRVAWLYERGAAKYGDRNWEKSETEETLAHHRAAFLRHVFKFYFGVEDGEDHAAAVVWNVNAMDLTRRKIKAKAEVL